MPTATAKDVKKSPIPKRILNRIDAAFAESRDLLARTQHPNDVARFQKKSDRDKKEVIAYIEDLIAKSAG